MITDDELRRVLAVRLRTGGVDTSIGRTQLGHNNIAATTRYLGHIVRRR